MTAHGRITGWVLVAAAARASRLAMFVVAPEHILTLLSTIRSASR